MSFVRRQACRGGEVLQDRLRVCYSGGPRWPEPLGQAHKTIIVHVLLGERAEPHWSVARLVALEYLWPIGPKSAGCPAGQPVSLPALAKPEVGMLGLL